MIEVNFEYSFFRRKSKHYRRPYCAMLVCRNGRRQSRPKYEEPQDFVFQAPLGATSAFACISSPLPTAPPSRSTKYSSLYRNSLRIFAGSLGHYAIASQAETPRLRLRGVLFPGRFTISQGHWLASLIFLRAGVDAVELLLLACFSLRLFLRMCLDPTEARGRSEMSQCSPGLWIFSLCFTFYQYLAVVAHASTEFCVVKFRFCSLLRYRAVNRNETSLVEVQRDGAYTRHLRLEYPRWRQSYNSLVRPSALNRDTRSREATTTSQP